jgi:hypothetical protein
LEDLGEKTLGGEPCGFPQSLIGHGTAFGLLFLKPIPQEQPIIGIPEYRYHAFSNIQPVAGNFTSQLNIFTTLRLKNPLFRSIFQDFQGISTGHGRIYDPRPLNLRPPALPDPAAGGSRVTERFPPAPRAGALREACPR